MKKVSVIIPMYNSSNYIEQCINTVVNQTYKNLEIIVVDDKSNDNSVKLIKNINDLRIKLIELKQNVGPANARNIGISEATGELLCFLDSDDYWRLEKIEKQVKFIEKNDYAFIYSGYEYLKKNTKRVVHVPQSLNYNQALKNTTIFTSTVMFNMKHLNKEDIYMPDVKSEDTATWWKVLKKGIKAYGMDENLVIYRVRKNSLSSNKFSELIKTWNLYKMEEISYFKKVNCFIFYVINAIKRRVSLSY